MSALEDELYGDLAYEEAEGESEMDDELEMEAFGFDDFDEADEDELELEAYDDEDGLFEVEAFDELDLYDEGDELDAFEEDEAFEDALDSVSAFAMDAEDADEFFGKLVRGLKKVGKKVVRGIKKAAPVVGRIASGVSRVAKLIPHPYAQAIGGAAGVIGKAARLAQKLRAEGASEEEALEAFAELAAKDPRALPIVAGLTARTVLKSKASRMSPAARKQVVKQMKGAAKTLVNRRGPGAVRAMPKIAKSVKRSAVAKGISPVAATKVVRRTAAKVARSPSLTRKLARPSPAAKRLVRSVGGGAPRSFMIPGPARITVSTV